MPTGGVGDSPGEEFSEDWRALALLGAVPHLRALLPRQHRLQDRPRHPHVRGARHPQVSLGRLFHFLLWQFSFLQMYPCLTRPVYHCMSPHVIGC